VGNVSAALQDLEQACERAGNPADADDLAATHARVAEILKQLGQDQRAATHQALALQFRGQHLAAQSELLHCLQSALPEAPERPM
jgi:hypothetical protein